VDRFYQRHLPHEIPEGVPLFVTWNLKGAMPAEAAADLAEQRRRLQEQPSRAGESPRDRKIRESKIIFGMADQILDTAAHGPMHLKDPGAARVVEDSILFGAVGRAFQPDGASEGRPGKADVRYELYAWCVMGNHVHVCLTPIWDLERLLQGIKGYTAHQINGLQGARGRVLWQDESYDHWARDEEELARIIAYIENNPVAAGLCQRPEDWPWSSARLRGRWPVGRPFQADMMPVDTSG
jgi:REP element-mobilizing transposase RayT